MEGIYKVNLIPSDLSTEETILQIADTLDNLDGIVNDVFERLARRIELNLGKARKVSDRVEIARKKVEKLSGMQTAIKVFSTAKYPASITHQNYRSVLDLDGYRHQPRKVALSRKAQGPAADKGIQEKLHFYHVKVGLPKNEKPRKDFDLSSVIDHMSTVGELLVFDTDESPYLSGTRATRYVPMIETGAQSKSLLDDAPSSIVKRDVLKREIDEYMYAPGIGMVPELEMPVDLPHLPGVAGDVQYSFASDGSIAPSVVTSPVANREVAEDLPDLSAELPDLADLPGLDDKSDVAAPPPVAVDVPDIPHAPQPPPPPSIPPVMLPPPPPPPPPPPAPLMEKSAATLEGTREDKSAASAAAGGGEGDAHASLMAAIRQAGGASRAKLRPAASSTPSKDSKATGGDLMADLHAKLTMRRRGISGAEQRGGARAGPGGAGGSLLHTLATVIPEPGDTTPQRSSSDDDWE